MPKKYNPNLPKIHRSYTVSEIAELFGVHKNTVREWLKQGLATADKNRPALILGSELRSFLQLTRRKHKRRCKLGELYCMSCREPRMPAGGMLDYEPASHSKGSVTGLCAVCDSIMYQFATIDKLHQIRQKMEVRIMSPPKRLSDRGECLINSDFKR